jgi:thiol:disulfide interchange protein
MNYIEFTEYQKNNETIFIIFFTAKWCKPCQTIKPYIHSKFTSSNIPYLYLDIDECSQLYTKFKSKKQVCGVPVLLAFKSKNISLIPDISVMGTDKKEIDLFFNSVSNILKSQLTSI